MKDLANCTTDRAIRAVRHDARQAVLTWDDGRASVFHATWLRDHCYLVEARGERQTRTRLWEAADLPGLPTFRHDALLHDDAALEAWLGALLETGVVFVDMPQAPGHVQKLAERVDPLRPTSFGTIFEVESKPDPNHSADMAPGLELQTDIPNVPYPPSIQFLHCIVIAAQGGGSILVDGFRAAEELRGANEAGFRLLASERIEFRFHDSEATCAIARRSSRSTTKAGSWRFGATTGSARPSTCRESESRPITPR